MEDKSLFRGRTPDQLDFERIDERSAAGWNVDIAKANLGECLVGLLE